MFKHMCAAPPGPAKALTVHIALTKQREAKMAMALPPTHEGQEIEFYIYIMQDGETFQTKMPVKINRTLAIDKIFEETPLDRLVAAFTGVSIAATLPLN